MGPCLPASQLPEDPESIDSVKIGTKVNEFGRDFQFFEKDGTIFYAYLDLIDNRLVEGRLSEDWVPEVVRTHELGAIRSLGLASFLVYENRDGRHDVLFHLKEGTFFWSHKDERWKEIHLQGDPDSLWHANPVQNDLPWEGVLFVGLGQRGEGYTYFRMDFDEERFERIADRQEANWKAIGRWNGQTVLASWKDYYTARRIRSSEWTFESFELESGDIGRPIAPRLLTRYRPLKGRVISTSDLNVAFLRNVRELFLYQLVDKAWEARNIRNENLIADIINARGPEREVSGDISGIDVVEKFGKVFVIYSSGAGVMLQVWSSDFSEFSEYWMGDFAFSTQDAVKFILSSPEEIVTLAKENLRAGEDGEFGVVDLVFRKWDLNDLDEVRSGTFETLEHAETVDPEVEVAADTGEQSPVKDRFRSMFETVTEEGLEAYLESSAFEADDFRDDNPYIQRSDIVKFIRDPYRLTRGIDSEQAKSATISRESELIRFIIESFGDVEEWLNENEGLTDDGRVRVKKLVEYFEKVDFATGVVP